MHVKFGFKKCRMCFNLNQKVIKKLHIRKFKIPSLNCAVNSIGIHDNLNITFDDNDNKKF